MIQTPSDLKTYRRRIAQALDNAFLGETLRNFARSYRESRRKAFAGLNFETLAGEIGRAKAQALTRLPELFEQFRKNAEAAGARVHLAVDAAEANRIIADIARDNDARLVVKSKSMTAEETHLNDHLEAEGFEVVETDLGEWIIQLRHEGPSHMVMPAIHLSRRQVGGLFEEVTGDPVDKDDIEGMVRVARRRLRPKYFEADMGVSGANFALADSGAIGLVTNEGNARLTTTLPRVHVALVGLDKLVPDLKTALNILKVLPKNATGQAISTYVTWIRGANECLPGPAGRKEFHIVFLDNGRSDLAADPDFSQALRCIRCGACANVCPVYQRIGGHALGHVYIGAIGLVLTLFYHGRDNARAIVQNCLNCQACRQVCPGGIDLPRLIKKVHGRVMAEDRRRPVKNKALARILPNRKLFHFLLRRAYLAQKPLADREGTLRHLPLFFSKDHEFRALPAVAARPLRDRWNDLTEPVPAPQIKAALFAGCLMDFVYPELGEKLIGMLKGRGVRLAFPKEQTCCGLPAQMSAEEETARIVAEQNIRAMDAENYDYVLTLCASCGSHIKEGYPELAAGDPDMEKRAKVLAGKIVDFSSFMTDILKYDGPAAGAQGKTAVYHAPCHLCRGLKVVDPPRRLLEKSGLRYIPLDNEETCCGFGGSWSFDFPSLSARILGDKLDAAEGAGADVIVTDCPGCLMQLRGGLRRRGSKTTARHMVEILD